MKSHHHRNTALAAAAASLTLFATATAQAAPTSEAIVESVAQLSVGAGVLDQDYVEHDDYGLVPTSYLDQEQGTIPAFSLDMGLVSPSGWYSELRFLYASGSTDYEGYLQSASGFTPYETETDNTMFGFSGNLGYLFALTPDIALAPKVELGHLRWEREITGPYGSDSEYTYTRYGAGAEVLIAATERLVFSVEGIYARQSGEVASDLFDEDIGTTAYTRFTAGVDYALTERWHIGAEVARIAYDSEESDVSASGFLEPASETTHIRAMANMGFAF